MTKDGRPSRIFDIRLFVGESSFRSTYLNGQNEVDAYARRMAWFLNGEGFSLGAFPALYVLFTTTVVDGEVRLTNDGAEWWHRYVHVGVSSDFPNVPDAPEVAMRGLVSALMAMRPDESDAIRRSDTMVRENGDCLRFLLRQRETKKLEIEISSNIVAWPKRSHLFIAHTDKVTGVYSEAEPIALRVYSECFDLLDGIRLQDAVNLNVKLTRPAMSGLIKRRG